MNDFLKERDDITKLPKGLQDPNFKGLFAMDQFNINEMDNENYLQLQNYVLTTLNELQLESGENPF